VSICYRRLTHRASGEKANIDAGPNPFSSLAPSIESLLNRSPSLLADFQSAIGGLAVEKRGVAHMEMFFVYVLAAAARPQQIIESGRGRGQSTIVLGKCFPNSRIISVENDAQSSDATFALDRLSGFRNVECLFGDSRDIIPKYLTPGIVVVIDGPKEFRALKLMTKLMRTGKPSMVFIHDLYAGSHERRFLERYFPDAIFSDHWDFVRQYSFLDRKDPTKPRQWNAFGCIPGGVSRCYSLLRIFLWFARAVSRLQPTDRSQSIV
jgi:Putative methyltransferase